MHPLVVIVMRHLPTMQRRDEHDLITTFEHIRPLAFQLPIRIIDEDKNTWSTFFFFSIVRACVCVGVSVRSGHGNGNGDGKGKDGSKRTRYRPP